MSTTLKSFGDDWHNPHPYEKLILSILPSLPYKLVDEIEHHLLSVYQAEHYGFKIFKDSSTQNLHDIEVSRWEEKVKSAEAELQKELDLIQNLRNRLEEKYQEQHKNGFSTDGDFQEISCSEEDYEMNEYSSQKDIRISNVKQTKQQAKAETKKKKELEKHLASSVKNMQASLQSYLLNYKELQEELKSLELQKKQCEQERNASVYFQNTLRKLVLEYEQTKEVEALIIGIKNIITKRAELLQIQ